MNNNYVHLCVAAMCLYLLSLGTASAAIIEFTATMDCAAASGGAGTCGDGGMGTGSVSATLDDSNNLFSWTVEWSGLTGPAIVAHFHGPAGPSGSAPPVVDIDHLSNPDMGSETITAQEADDLLNGLWYANIHTSMFPGGEIRGQVSIIPIPAAAWFIISGLAVIATRVRHRSPRL